MIDSIDLKKHQLHRRSGKELLEEYQSLDSSQDRMIAIYQHVLIEKYAEEIGYNKGEN